MTEELKGWRALPLVLRIGLVLDLVYVIGYKTYYFEHDFSEPAVRAELALGGIGLVVDAFCAIGLYDLVRQVTGPRAAWVRIAAYGFTLALALNVGFELASFSGSLFEHRWVFDVEEYGWLAARLAVPIGLAIAVIEQKRGLALGGFAAAVFLNLPHQATKALYGGLDLSFRQASVLDGVLRSAHIAVVIALACAVARGGEVVDPKRAIAGLRAAAGALWLRVVAAVGGAMFAMFAVLGGGEGSISLIKLTMIAALALNLVALARFAIGAVSAGRAALSDLPRLALLISGALSLWCAGVMLAQLPHVYRALYGGHDSFLGGDGDAEKYLQAWSVGAPLVAIASIAIVAAVLGAYASRRSFEDLRIHASGKGVGFVALMLASVGIQSWLLPHADSRDSFILMTLGAAGAGLWATVLMAKLCALGADAIDREPGLPTATVVQGQAP